jgi:hypothetical protein
VVVDAEVNEANKTTLRSERRSAFKKGLTGPTLLEMSGKRVNQDLVELPSLGEGLTLYRHFDAVESCSCMAFSKVASGCAPLKKIPLMKNPGVPLTPARIPS